jgi:hypothetical protein
MWKKIVFILVNVLYTCCIYITLTESESFLARIFVPFFVVVLYCCLRGLSSFIILERGKINRVFPYILFVNIAEIIVITIGLQKCLQTLPSIVSIAIFVIVLFIIILIFCLCVFGYIKDADEILKKTIMQFDKSWHTSEVFYPWNEGIMDFVWLPVNNNKFEPHFNYGDMLCIKEVIPVYKDDYLDFNTHRNWKYVVKDNNGVFHLCATEIREIEKDGVWSRVEAIIPYPNMELDKDNVKCLYEVVDEIRNFNAKDKDGFYKPI